MRSQLRPQVAFRYMGLHGHGGPEPLGATELRPALLARYRDLDLLRYDFPLVLVRGAEPEACVQTLTAIFDRVMREASPEGAAGERFRKRVLRLEREIRALGAAGTNARLGELCRLAIGRLEAAADESFASDLERARAAIKLDGDVVDCGARLPMAFLTHAWKAIHQRKAARFADESNRLLLGLADILAADSVRSTTGRSARRLREGMGATDRDDIDFGVMSRLLERSMTGRSLPASRRRRIRGLVSTLRNQRLYTGSPHAFVFTRCADALTALHEQLPHMVEVTRALAMARLEVAGEYVPSMHDALFNPARDAAIASEDLAQFPDMLVCLNADELDASEHAELLELLASGANVKVLVQTDDVLGPPLSPGLLPQFAARSHALAGLAIGLGEVFVVQASASNLNAVRARVLHGLEYRGPALFSVFSGASPGYASLPPYLVAAAAQESRAFPSFTYDPTIDEASASRHSVEGNPQPEQDWPVHRLDFEDAGLQRKSEEVSFTLVDFVACDTRYAQQFAKAPADAAKDERIPVAEALDQDGEAGLDRVACVRVVDDDDMLHDLLVAEPLIRQARRAREGWRHLQRLARAPGRAQSEPAPEPESRAAPVAEPVAQPVAAPAAAPAPAPAAPVAEAPGAPASGEAYIETPRCTTCDECTQLNNRMFAYDANKQAYIANIDAGTYRELVEAAESCQVSIIHPGKPRNPDEPGLEELLQRAEAFA